MRRPWNWAQAYKDSNLDKQNQNLLCYRYTIGLNPKIPEGSGIERED